MLAYEYELRKRVFKRVRDDGFSLMDSLKMAETDYEARELHFTSLLAMGGRGGSSGSGNKDNARQRDDDREANARDKRPRTGNNRPQGKKGDGKKGGRQNDGNKNKQDKGPPFQQDEAAPGDAGPAADLFQI